MRDNLFRKSYFFKWIIYDLNGRFFNKDSGVTFISKSLGKFISMGISTYKGSILPKRLKKLAESGLSITTEKDCIKPFL